MDPTAIPIVYGGCPYEWPVGECQNNDPAKDNAKGCAAELEDLLSQQVGSIATALMALSVLPGLAAFVSCCLCLKRKTYDVLPATYPGLVAKRQKVQEKPDVDGILMLTVAEKSHEFIAASTRLSAECRGTYEKVWDEEQLMRLAAEKKEKHSGAGWNKEVQTAYIKCLKGAAD